MLITVLCFETKVSKTWSLSLRSSVRVGREKANSYHYCNTMWLSTVSVMGVGREAGRQCFVRVHVRELLIRSQEVLFEVSVKQK